MGQSGATLRGVLDYADGSVNNAFARDDCTSLFEIVPVSSRTGTIASRQPHSGGHGILGECSRLSVTDRD